MLTPGQDKLTAYQHSDFAHVYEFKDLDLSTKRAECKIYNRAFVEQTEFNVQITNNKIALFLENADLPPIGSYEARLKIANESDPAGAGQYYIIIEFKVQK